jgi:hypothetical protein
MREFEDIRDQWMIVSFNSGLKLNDRDGEPVEAASEAHVSRGDHQEE